MPDVLTTAGPEILVNQILGNVSLANPQVVGLAGGGWVVVWDSFGQDEPFGLGVFGQRYDASGAKLGAAFQVNTTTDLDQAGPQVAALADGGFVVTFGTYFNREGTTTPFSIHAQRYDAAGARVGAERLISETPANDYLGAPVAALADGSYVVAYPVADASGFGVGLQRIGQGGTSGPTVLANATQAGSQSSADIVGLAGGGFVVTWTSQDGSGVGVFSQRFDAVGGRLGGEIRVNATTASHQGDAAVTALASGGYVVSWMSEGQDGSFLGVFAQLFSATGARVGGEVQVNTTTARNQFDPSVVGLANGGYAVVWVSDDQDGSGVGIFARQFSASGAPVSGEVLVNATTAGFQLKPDVTALADGRLVVTWLSNDGSGSGTNLVQRIVEPSDATTPPPPPPPPTGTTLTLTAGADTLVAAAADQAVLTRPGDLGAADRLDAGGGLDTMRLTASGVLDLTAPATFSGFEQLFGAAGDDTFLVSAARLAGVTTIDGGAGFDRLQLKSAGTLDLAGVNLANVELIAGSAGGDKLRGNDADNVLSGGAGNDELDGRGGLDTASYADAAGGVEVSLASTSAQRTGGAGRDTLRSIENLTGSAFDDTLTGSSGANVIRGGGGADQLTGAGGADAFVYGALSDSAANAPDLITDFSRAQGDRIDLRGIDAVAGGADNAFVFAATFTGVAGQLVAGATPSGRTVVLGDTNGDRNADFVIQVITPSALTAGDFLL